MEIWEQMRKDASMRGSSGIGSAGTFTEGRRDF